ncbi:hypothetical protein NQ318_011016 [Aromia moschata]|uniref:tRNA-uridine aminocarboxypropyltransferase 1 n=1 Tax=Aromia moschata TaxID=1265417 RepID=A0AAV8YSF5_9CUCU|nr:hypothetical protein NQ318_011016 [Aromia moschata]
MSNPKSEQSRQSYIDQKPFEGIKIDDNSILDSLEGRHPCPKCGKSRKFYCYSCYVPIQELQGKLPKVILPFKIDIIKHKREIDGKSTAGHAAVLAPDHVTIYTYPDIPDYNEENAVLIFPSQSAISVNQLVNGSNPELEELQDEILDVPKGYHRSTLMKTIPKSKQEYRFSGKTTKLPITKAIFIDSTWNQSKGIYKDEKIGKIPCVVIQNRISQFWRHQKGSPRWYLSTIEAIHQFLIETHLHIWGRGLSHLNLLYNTSGEAYNGQYDNLLFFFQHMYELIHKYYQHEDLYAYKRRLI